MDELTRLLLQAGRDDSDALREFISSAQPDVWRFCAAMLSAAEADDATQETFVRAWRSAPAFRAESSARTWLMSIARRVCFNRIDRQIRHTARSAQLADPNGADPAAGDHSETVALNALVRRLPADRRSAFVLTQILGFSYQEAAQAAGCPLGTIRSRVSRARAELQALLGGTQPASGQRTY